MKTSKTYLHYGSKITLRIPTEDKTFICGEGFIMKNIFTQNFA